MKELSIDEAVQRLQASQESAEQETSTQEVETTDTTTEAETANPEQEAVEFTNQDDEVQPSEDSEQEEVDLEQAQEILEDGQEVQTESEPETKMFKVKVNGEEQEVSEDEVRNGYMRNADYTRKSQEVAEMRKSFESEKTDLLKLREEYSSKLADDINLSRDLIEQQFEGVNWKELQESDPEQYLMLKDRRNTLDSKLKAKQQELSDLIAKDQQERNQKLQEATREEFKKLQEKDPEFAKDAQAKFNVISSYMIEEGFAENEVNSLIDHRHFLLVDKARKYDDLMKKIKTSKKKTTSVPKFVKSGTNSEVKAANAVDKRKALKSIRPGDFESAARVLTKLNQ